jgi:hypothetical protein
MVFVDLIGTLGFLITFFLIIAPAKSIYEGIQKMEIKNLTLEYFLIGIIQSICWDTFGHKSDDLYVYITNDVAIFFYIVYLNCFLYINRKTMHILYYDASILLVIVFFATSVSAKISSFLASIISCIWQLTTIRNLRTSISLKDASFINLFLALMSLIVFGLWALYSILTNNFVMLIPNFVGLVLWGINITIYYWACNSIPDDHFGIKIIKTLLVIDDSIKEERLLTSLKTAGGSEKI